MKVEFFLREVWSRGGIENGVTVKMRFVNKMQSPS